MKNAIVLCCAIVILLAFPHLVRGQHITNREPFTRLMERIDHAPVDFEALDGPARRSSDMQATAHRFSDAIAPVTPVLHSIADSKTLELLGKAPIIGSPIHLATLSIGAVAELGSGFVKLVSLDKEQLQPVRDAIQAAARLRRSRNPADVPAVTASMKGAAAPLDAWVESGELQERRLSSLADGFERLNRLHPGGNGRGTKLLLATTKIRQIQASVELRLQSIRRVRSYVEECVQAGEAVTSASSIVVAEPAPASPGAGGLMTKGDRVPVTAALPTTTRRGGKRAAALPASSRRTPAPDAASVGAAGAAGGGGAGDPQPFPLGAVIYGLAAILLGCTLAYAAIYRPKPPVRLAAQAAQTAVLEVTEPDGRSREIRLPPNRGVLIGRGPDCDVQINDEMTSYRHALLQQVGERYVLKDSGSTNGVYVNECRVTEATVGEEDVILIGQTHLRVRGRASSL